MNEGKGRRSMASLSTSQLASSSNTAGRGRIYPIESAGMTKLVTREIAALDFLLGIPMEGEEAIVQNGWHRMQQQPTGMWWEKFVQRPQRRGSGESVLEQPTRDLTDEIESAASVPKPSIALQTRAGGRRLDGDKALKVRIPQSGFARTRQRSIARQAAIREFEARTAHGSPRDPAAGGLLLGRVFFSAKDNYPVGVFSVLRYEPKREEAARRRRKVEAGGGGGTSFEVPQRDWRGTSYRALLPQKQEGKDVFNRFVRTYDGTTTDELSLSVEEDEESDAYVPGFLDDPEMVQGRHRNVVVGDRIVGCTISSTIQFVKPVDLKADLNKQFRGRFDGWEPPKTRRRYIGAKVVNGVYTLMDPTETENREAEGTGPDDATPSKRPGDGMDSHILRMPPSLTLSKIRSIKQQALMAAVRANLEISTVAIACVYFERLCLDCRVDKSNRRLSFAACLLLAAKINESHVRLATAKQDSTSKEKSVGGNRSGDGVVSGTDDDANKDKRSTAAFIKPNDQSHIIFASLLEFFTKDWELSLNDLFIAEWGVFVALEFSLTPTPAQVSFHYKRLMKSLGWKTIAYLGSTMHDQWMTWGDEESTRPIRE